LAVPEPEPVDEELLPPQAATTNEAAAAAVANASHRALGRESDGVINLPPCARISQGSFCLPMKTRQFDHDVQVYGNLATDP
jgi:hypothetical protein